MVYLAYTGQRRAHDDMRTLKEFVDGALGCDCFKVAMEHARVTINAKAADPCNKLVAPTVFVKSSY